MRLYELAAEYAAVADRAEDGEDITEQLEALEGALEDKSSAIVHVLRNVETEAEKFKVEEKRLSDRRRALENNALRLREYIRSCMQGAGVEKLEAGTFSIALREGPARVVVEDDSIVPEQFVRVKVEVDKAKVLQAYKADGEVVRGTSIERGTTLVIR